MKETVKEMAWDQYVHIQLFDEARQMLDALYAVEPFTNGRIEKDIEKQKKIVFEEYYQSTRSITRENEVLTIHVDEEIIAILNPVLTPIK